MAETTPAKFLTDKELDDACHKPDESTKVKYITPNSKAIVGFPQKFCQTSIIRSSTLIQTYIRLVIIRTVDDGMCLCSNIWRKENSKILSK